MSMEMEVVKYRCSNSKCAAVDTLRHEHGEPTRPMLDCYKCHAGQGKQVAEQLEKHIGMFPVGRWPDQEYDRTVAYERSKVAAFPTPTDTAVGTEA